MSDLLIKAPIEYEPLRKNRFLMRFPSDLGIQEWWVSNAARPTITMKDVEIPFLNTSTWVGPSASQAVMEWVRLASESVTGRQGYAVAYKRDLVLEMLDPTGTAVSQWIIKNAMPTTVSFGDLSYDDDSLSTIEITIRPDYCILSF